MQFTLDADHFVHPALAKHTLDSRIRGVNAAQCLEIAAVERIHILANNSFIHFMLVHGIELIIDKRLSERTDIFFRWRDDGARKMARPWTTRSKFPPAGQSEQQTGISHFRRRIIFLQKYTGACLKPHNFLLGPLLA